MMAPTKDELMEAVDKIDEVRSIICRLVEKFIYVNAELLELQGKIDPRGD